MEQALTEHVKALQAHTYQLWDVTWFKVTALQDYLDRYARLGYHDPDERALITGWMAGDPAASGREMAQTYVDEMLRGVLPEDSIWGELYSDPDETRWRPLPCPAAERLDHFMRFNYFQGDDYNPDRDSGHTWSERPPTDEERAWYRYAREAFFTIFPPDSARFFEPVPRDDEPEPWDVPLVMVAVSRSHAGAAFYHGTLWEKDYRQVMEEG